jgi:hypothetical protein
VLGGLILFVVLGWSMYLDWLSPYAKHYNSAEASFTGWQMTFPPHWAVGGVAILVVVAAVIGVLAMVAYNIARPAFFRGDVLNKHTPTLVPEGTGMPAGWPPAVTSGEVPEGAPLVRPPYSEGTGPNPVPGVEEAEH